MNIPYVTTYTAHINHKQYQRKLHGHFVSKHYSTKVVPYLQLTLNALDHYLIELISPNIYNRRLLHTIGYDLLHAHHPPANANHSLPLTPPTDHKTDAHTSTSDHHPLQQAQHSHAPQKPKITPSTPWCVYQHNSNTTSLSEISTYTLLDLQTITTTLNQKVNPFHRLFTHITCANAEGHHHMQTRCA